jgi:signal transduction histidine kinase
MLERGEARGIGAGDAEGRDGVLACALADLGTGVGVDRSHVTVFSTDRSRMTRTHEWVAPGVPPQRHHVRDAPLATLPWCTARLLAGETVTVPDLEGLPAAAATDRATCRAQAICATLLVPLLADGVTIGFVGVEVVRATRAWPAGDPALLRIVGALAVNAAALARSREELEDQVAARTRELTTLLAVGRTMASTLELAPLLDLILDQLRAVVDYGAAAIWTVEGEALATRAYRGPLPQEDAARRRLPLARAVAYREAERLGWPVIVIVDDTLDPGGAVRLLTPGGATDATDPRPPRAEEIRRRTPGLASGDARCLLSVPLMVRERVLGILRLESTTPYRYTARDGDLALALAGHAAVAIENARLYEAARGRAALEERQRLARELHDSVTQALFSATLHARAAQLALERAGQSVGSPAGRAIDQLRALIQGALAEMRALIFELRPGALAEEGLAAALIKHAAALAARAELVVAVEAPAGRLPLAPAVEEHLYRLAQEALHNVVKHAGARGATVRLAAAGADLTLEVADDGAGFDPATPVPGHLGLGTMAERARAAGGRLSIASAPGAGTTVRVVVPEALRAAGPTTTGASA